MPTKPRGLKTCRCHCCPEAKEVGSYSQVSLRGNWWTLESGLYTMPRSSGSVMPRSGNKAQFSTIIFTTKKRIRASCPQFGRWKRFGIGAIQSKELKQGVKVCMAFQGILDILHKIFKGFSTARNRSAKSGSHALWASRSVGLTGFRHRAG